jgi:hypothetical protein
MNRLPTKSEPPPPQDPQRIAKLARTYAQNRSLGVVVMIMVLVVLYAAIGGPSYLAGGAYRSGNMLLFWVSIAVLVPALGAVIYLSVPKWGGKFQDRVVRRLYAKEGNVAFSVPGQSKKIWGLVLGGCFGTCIVAFVAMGFVIEIPIKYMQPISALYTVPFLVGLWFLMRPMAGYAALLWPLLYAIHAILIVAGAPIVFTSPWDGLNMLIPIAGYGVLSGLVGHLYSRVALRQLKALTQTDLTGADQPEEASGQ